MYLVHYHQRGYPTRYCNNSAATVHYSSLRNVFSLLFRDYIASLGRIVCVGIAQETQISDMNNAARYDLPIERHFKSP